MKINDLNQIVKEGKSETIQISMDDARGFLEEFTEMDRAVWGIQDRCEKQIKELEKKHAEAMKAKDDEFNSLKNRKYAVQRFEKEDDSETWKLAVWIIILGFALASILFMASQNGGVAKLW
jgi:hypothetical protein